RPAAFTCAGCARRRNQPRALRGDREARENLPARARDLAGEVGGRGGPPPAPAARTERRAGRSSAGPGPILTRGGTCPAAGWVRSVAHRGAEGTDGADLRRL